MSTRHRVFSKLHLVLHSYRFTFPVSVGKLFKAVGSDKASPRAYLLPYLLSCFLTFLFELFAHVPESFWQLAISSTFYCATRRQRRAPARSQLACVRSNPARKSLLMTALLQVVYRKTDRCDVDPRTSTPPGEHANGHRVIQVARTFRRPECT